jgi:hypothetical protein
MRCICVCFVMTESSLWGLSDLNDSCVPELVRQALEGRVIGSNLVDYQPLQVS